MDNNSNYKMTQQSVGFSGLLTIVFIVLKLCKVINWSWWWVLSPIWIPTVIVVLIIVMVFGVVIINEIIRDKKNKR